MGKDTSKKVVLLGNTGKGSLESSYKRAFEYLGHQVIQLNVNQAIENYVPFGKLGKYINTFIGIESWIKKGNRDLALQIKNYDPDICLVFCNAEFIAGSLAFLKSVSACKIGLIWPDTLFNLNKDVITNHLLYDFVATYSSTSVPIFEILNFKNVFWLPLAADQWLHGVKTISSKYQFDISFIGGWRPERENTLRIIKENFPGAKLLIKGPEWAKRCKVPSLREQIDDGPAIGKHFSELINASKINLNIIDDTNYPAANMRFFEIPMCNGFQLSSPCPEFESVLIDQQHLAYYSSESTLIAQIKHLLDMDERDLIKIIKKSNQLITEEHTYVHRVESLLKKVL